MSTFRGETMQLAALRLGPPPQYTFNGKQRSMNGSHRCHNIRCVRADHIIWNTRKENHNRDFCRHGCFSHCPHLPKCIWQREGVFLVCRNSPNTLACVAGCNLGCFSECFLPLLFVDIVCPLCRLMAHSISLFFRILLYYALCTKVLRLSDLFLSPLWLHKIFSLKRVFKLFGGLKVKVSI